MYEFVETTQRIIYLYHIRLVGGLLYFVGALIGGYNLLRTWQTRPAKYEEVVHQAASLRDTPLIPEQMPESKLDGVANIGRKIDIWWTFWWHRAWERMPLKFTVMTILAVVIASAISQIPAFVIRSNVARLPQVQPYTPLELAGRDIYVAEGCYNCHSQQIRPMVSEKQRYGDYSLEGEFVYDHPFQWGSRRIGPDVAREGGKQSHQWHVLHFRNPAESNAGSIMPAYPFLMTKKLDFNSIPARVGAMMVLHPDAYPQYEDGNLAQAQLDAQAQANQIAAEFKQQNGGDYIDDRGAQVDLSDKQVIALIAYLQRLGTDRYREVPTETSPDTPLQAEADLASSAQSQSVGEPLATKGAQNE
jgi:cytochrome c oxidase cbb3-type subunit I/II